jgi:hypothetical protein
MQGCYIFHGVVIFHGNGSRTTSEKMNGVILKNDFENGYGKIKWSFLQQTLRRKGFLMSAAL